MKTEKLNSFKESAEAKNVLGLLESNVKQIDSKGMEIQKKILEDISKNVTFINRCNKIPIRGSKEVIEVFNSLDIKKFDEITPLKNISNIKLIKNGKKNARTLYFGSLSITDDEENSISTIHNGQIDFMSKIFKIEAFSKLIFEVTDEDFIPSTINSVIEFMPEKKYRFRYLKNDKGENFLRAVTSDRYKPYDNNIVLYLTFVVVSNYCEQMKTTFQIDKCSISDSKFEIYLYSNDEYNVSKDISIKTGIEVLNSELSDGAVSFKFTYKVYNRKNRKSKFTVLSKEVFKINHGWRSQRIAEALNNIDDINEYTGDIIQVVKRAGLDKKLSDVEMYSIFDDLITGRGSKISDNVKIKVLDLKTKIETEKNTFNILELFSKLDNIPKDTDSEMFIRYKFDRYIHSNKW